MNPIEKDIISKFKALLLKKIPIYKMFLFGSRSRGEASQYSDMDVVVITEEKPDDSSLDYISDCAWEAGFEYGIVVVPVVFSKEEWENSPEQYSLLAKAVDIEGVAV